MNTGQMMLVIGAFAMLSILALSFNSTMFGSLKLGLEMEATLNALSIGQSMMDEILAKDFDQKTTGGAKAFNYSDVTVPASLGSDGGEAISYTDSSYTLSGTFHDFASKSKFNDVDDYHLYKRKVKDPRLGYFFVYDTVKYCSEYTPANDTTSATFYKKIVVVVTHPNLPTLNDTAHTTVPIILKDIAIYRRYF
ncbi:MAG: hypothetical protein HY088_01805 [Ignavibacteriales bacterium]|nr:hypothetical protein [Ignavibacteriales bacterium]